MKTQFIVTIAQTGEKPATAKYLENELRSAVKDNFTNITGKVTVRHSPEEPEPAQPLAGDDLTVGRLALRNVVFDAHRAGQATGRLLPKDGRDRATAFADEVVAVLAKVSP